MSKNTTLALIFGMIIGMIVSWIFFIKFAVPYMLPQRLEDAGKHIVEQQPEVKALMTKYGKDQVLVTALDREIIGNPTAQDKKWFEMHSQLLTEVLMPGLKREQIGCVIFAYAMGEGYVYWEDKDLKIITSETLADFEKHTAGVPKEDMARFYLSLR